MCQNCTLFTFLITLMGLKGGATGVGKNTKSADFWPHNTLWWKSELKVWLTYQVWCDRWHFADIFFNHNCVNYWSHWSTSGETSPDNVLYFLVRLGLINYNIDCARAHTGKITTTINAPWRYLLFIVPSKINRPFFNLGCKVWSF